MSETKKTDYNEELRNRLDVPEILGSDGWEEDYEDWFINLSEELKEKVFTELSTALVKIDAAVQAFIKTDSAVQAGQIYIADNELSYMFEELCGQNREKVSEVLQAFGWSDPLQ